MLQNFTIRFKIRLVFGALLISFLIIGALTVLRMQEIGVVTSSIRNNTLPTTQLIGQITRIFKDHRVFEAEFILSTSPADMSRIDAAMHQSAAEMSGLRGQLEPLLSDGTERVLYDKFIASWTGYIAEATQMIVAARASQDEKALAIYRASGEGNLTNAKNALNDLIANNISEGNKNTDRAASMAQMTSLVNITMIALAVALCLFGMTTVVRTVSTPILRIADIMKRLSGHDFSVKLEGAERRDELGAMVRSIMVFRDNMARADALTQRESEDEKAKQRRQIKFEARVKEFAATIGDELDQLLKAAAQMRTLAETMTQSAEKTNEQANEVAMAAQQASENVSIVASATRELAASVLSVGQQVVTSNDIATKAVDEANQTNITVLGLSEAAQRINHVSRLIGEIASQTNLLALNATIEAARAGDAGKGFAVVASEVKTLASQTAKATNDIAGQISAMQKATSEAVEAIRRISGTITEISQISIVVSAAVEEQDATTQEIHRSTEQAARGTSQVTNNIITVSESSNATGTAAGEVLQATIVLAEQADRLRVDIGTFIDDIRAA